MKTLAKYSMGTGDRFAQQGKAQLSAFIKAKADFGVDITPVWNKSYREHQIIGTNPDSTRAEADAAVKALNWNGQYCVDADHIGLGNVDLFMDAADFFTLDVADFTGEKASQASIDSFVAKHGGRAGKISLPGKKDTIEISEADIKLAAEKYLLAVQEAGKIYRRIEEAKGKGNFIAEVSMDETDNPQTPAELIFILAAVADEGIPAQTIAPKFSGRFNKGVDYVGDVEQFNREFEDDICVIAYAVKEFGLPSNLKLSVHSGSDKFSIYHGINAAIKKHDAGVHVKTAGTTWLEEIIGLAEAGGDALEMAKDIYAKSLDKFDALCGPYATVIDIDKSGLPAAAEVAKWTSDQYARALRHVQDDELYNPNFRQLLHVGYKIAADLGDSYLSTLKANEDVVAHHVSTNIFDRHMKRVFF